MRKVNVDDFKINIDSDELTGGTAINNKNVKDVVAFLIIDNQVSFYPSNCKFDENELEERILEIYNDRGK